MNINLGLSKNYEMNSLADPDKTKPILPRLSQRRLGSSLYLKAVLSEESCRRCKACARARPEVYYSTSRTGCVLVTQCLHALGADAQEVRSKIPVFVLLYMLQSHRRLPVRQFFTPKPPILTSQLSQTFTRSSNPANLFQRNSTTFYKFGIDFCKFSNFETLSNTPNPHFSPKNKGDPAPAKLPTPIFSPKTNPKILSPKPEPAEYSFFHAQSSSSRHAISYPQP